MHDSLSAYECYANTSDLFDHYSPIPIELTAQRPPSEGVMHSMEVGDEFQFRQLNNTQAPIYDRYLVTGKEHLENGFSYTIFHEKMHIISEIGYPDTMNVYTNTITRTFSDTSRIFAGNLLPNQVSPFPYFRTSPATTASIENTVSDSGTLLDQLLESCAFTIVKATTLGNFFDAGEDCAIHHSGLGGFSVDMFYLSGIALRGVGSGSGANGNAFEHFPIYINTSTCQFGSRMHVGVEETARMTMNLHPNPASTILRFDSPSPSAYTVMDAMGRTVLHGQAQQGGNTLGVDGLRDGMYVLRLGDGSGAVRFVKVGR